MTGFIAKTAIAALVALSGLSATAPIAAAAGPDLVIQAQYHHDRDWRRHDRHDDRRHHPDRRPAGCAPWLAEQKANRMGLHRTRVVGMSHRTVTVAGFNRHGHDRMVFANLHGCPLIRR